MFQGRKEKERGEDEENTEGREKRGDDRGINRSKERRVHLPSA